MFQKNEAKNISRKGRVSNCVTRFLKQFEAKRIEAMEIDILLTKIEEGSSSVLPVLATIRKFAPPPKKKD